jgi:hypothetical protein
MSSITTVWHSNSSEPWEQGLKDYWAFIKPQLRPIEHEIQNLDLEAVRVMDAQQWYGFLLEKYFRWKYTAPNRYASTTKSLKEYSRDARMLNFLLGIKERLFAADKNDIKLCLTTACLIGGLGPAGASGLLAVLFPEHFGTIDQFAVAALLQIMDLPERAKVLAIKNPESLKVSEGVLLIEIMRRKAEALNALFSTGTWTPRKVDMVLWTYGHGRKNGYSKFSSPC